MRPLNIGTARNRLRSDSQTKTHHRKAVTEKSHQIKTQAYRVAPEATSGKIVTLLPRWRRWPWAARLLAAMFALLVVLVCVIGVLAARLAAGPVSLNWLVPFVQSMLSKHGGPVQIQLKEATLTWQDWGEGPTLSLGDAHIAASDGSYAADVNTFQASVSALSILHGQPVPHRLSANGIRAMVLLPEASTAGADHETASAPTLDGLIDTGPLRFIDSISVDDVAIALADAPGQVVWRGQIDTLQLQRDPSGLSGSARVTLDQAGVPGYANLAVQSDATTKLTTVSADFSTIRLPAFAKLGGADLAPLSILDVPLSGTATATLTAEAAPQAVSLKLAGEAGRLVLTPEVAKQFGIPDAAQTVPLRSLALQVTGQPDEKKWTVESLQLRLADTAVVSVPAPIGKRIPLRQITGQATYAGDQLTVTTLGIDLDRPRFAITADIKDLTGKAQGPARVVLRGATVADVRAYWPPQMAASAFDWVNTHLVAGEIAEAVLQMSVGEAAGETTVTALQLTIPVEGAVVDYLKPLPAVRDGQVMVGLDLKTLSVDIRRATVGRLVVSDGRVVIPDYNADVSTIDIGFNVDGGLPDLVELLSTKPLDFVPTDVIHPSDFGGRFDARVSLHFPLVEDLDVDELVVIVNAMTNGASFSLPAKDVAVQDGNLHIMVNDDGLHAFGTLAVNGARGIVDWQEAFVETTPIRRSIDFRLSNAAVASVRKNLEPKVNLAPYLLGGQFDGVVRYKEARQGDAWIDGTLELNDAEVAIPELRWTKPKGQVATVQAQVEMSGGQISVIRNFELAGGAADVHGSALFTDQGSLHSLEVNRFVLGRSHLKAIVHSQDGGKGWDISVTGPSLDIAPFLSNEERPKPANDTESTEKGPGPNLNVSADFDRVWITDETPVQAVLLRATRTAGVWQTVMARGQTNATAPFSIEMAPSENGQHTITIAAENAGTTLEALGLSSNFHGGRLSGQATGALSTDDLQLTGEIRMDRFHLVKAPLVARVLDVMAVTGLRDVLSGRGIAFSALRIPFSVNGGVIELRDARAAGASLGMTTTGSIDLDQQTLDLKGIVVPFYWANAALGNLPILGPLLTGGQSGGGVFSATYELTGPVEDPRMRVNAFSIMLPSVIRYILELIQGWIVPSGNNQVSVAPSP